MEGVFHLQEECFVITNLVFLVGLLYLLRIIVWLTSSLWSGTKAFVLSDIFRVNLKSSSYGWAVVTGASAGIGKEYALQLAKCGIDVVLVSRSMDKLKSVEKEILDQYKVSVKIIVVDFSDGAEIYDKIREELSQLEIGILINNVGVCYEYPDFFLNVPEDRLWQLINVNVAAVVMMTKMILPDMLKKKRGIIVNVSSSGGLSLLPLMTVYAASKSFINHFTSALQYEYSGKGIFIQLALPGTVATAMSGIQKANALVPSPQKYVWDALATIGVQSRTCGTVSHSLQLWLLQLLPPWITARCIYHVFNYARKMMIKEKLTKK